MVIRNWTWLGGAFALLCLGAANAEPLTTESSPRAQTVLEQLASRAQPEVGLYYSRALAPEEYSDFRHFVGVQLALGALIDPTLVIKASLSLDREIGAPIEAFRASNTTLSVAKLYNFEKIGRLKPSFFIKLPTHDEDRQYLSYRGSFGLAAGLLNERIFTFGNAHALGAGLTLTSARNLFAYTTSMEGALANRLWTVAGSASVVYTLYEKFSLTFSFRNTYSWTWEGRDDDGYELGWAIQYLAPHGLRFALSMVTSDRTFQHDQMTLNVNLYKPESTLMVFTVAYAPAFDVL